MKGFIIVVAFCLIYACSSSSESDQARQEAAKYAPELARTQQDKELRKVEKELFKYLAEQEKMRETAQQKKKRKEGKKR